MKNIFKHEDLYEIGKQRIFKNDAREAAFLLGGIGTGNVSLGARGELRDWELFNKPGKGDKLDYTFFSIYTREKGKAPAVRILEACLEPPYSNGRGFGAAESAGLPRFKGSNMQGEYPFVEIVFFDDELPVSVSLEAFTPFIPLNPEDSGIPCAILNYKVKNRSRNPVDVTITGTLQNSVGICGADKFGWPEGYDFSGNINKFRQEDGISGIYMYSLNFKEDYIRYGSLSLMTPETKITFKEYWMEGSWRDGAHNFWDDFKIDGLLEPFSSTNAIGCKMIGNDSRPKYGSLGIPCSLAPQEEKEFTFVLSWYFPNRIKYWNEWVKTPKTESPVIKNHYGVIFGDAWDVGRYTIENYKRLVSESRKFHDALFQSTLPGYVIDSVASNITVMRSPTCIWLEDGTMVAWEGCSDEIGCCMGTCTHVWNYAQTIAFLFPTLEQTMRTVEFCKETDESGNMAFRTNAVYDLPRWDFHPAADGQMGTIIRLYREWKISGDSGFLRKVWDGAKRALNFAFGYWDSDGDFVLDSQQHNTYDIEFYGPNSLTNSMFFAALKAGAEMAREMGDTESALKYESTLEKGSSRMDELLWGGEYYIQKIEDVDKYKYQYGKGCLADQLLGQLLAHVVGLGYILPEDHVKKAVKSIFEYNFMSDFYNHINVQRTYALNNEKGLLLCSWPQGGRPKLPFIYSDEVWTGIEYHVAAHLIYEGFVEEGLTIVKAVRDRHDGYRRNPWNEVECGHHYARSMASWALLTALSGFRCDMVKKVICFSPKINRENFSTFWSTGTAWGVYKQTIDGETGKCTYKIDVLYGSIDGVNIIVDSDEKS